jgi:hypothetical protein
LPDNHPIKSETADIKAITTKLTPSVTANFHTPIAIVRMSFPFRIGR